MARRLQIGTGPWCRFGCNEIETTHHLFVLCPHFSVLRASSSESITEEIASLIPPDMCPATQMSILDITRALFEDSDQWPAYLTRYYLGFTPVISSLPWHIFQTISNIWHTESIKLAGKIWAAVRRKGFQDKYLSDARKNSYETPDFIHETFSI